MWPTILILGAGTLLFLSRKKAPSGPIKNLVLLGDSLAVGMTPHLKAWAKQNNIDFRADAKVGRMTKQQVVGDVKNATVLVSLGTNDAVKAGAQPQIQEFAQKLVSAGAAQIFWLVPPGGDRLPGIAEARSAIKSAPVIPVTVKVGIAKDGLHPTNYKTVASAMVEAVKAH